MHAQALDAHGSAHPILSRALRLCVMRMCHAAVIVAAATRVAPPCRSSGLQMNFFEKFMQEVDNFADDAMGRRLGNGAKFYGKRKSSFYGEDDELRKKDPTAFDKEEDYSGPGGGSFFLLSKERDEKGRPMGFLTRKEARELQAAEEAAIWEQQRYQESMLSGFKAGLEDGEERSGQS